MISIIMASSSLRSCFFCFGILFVLFSTDLTSGAEVSHDGRAITIDGQRRIILSGSIHYPRSIPQVIKITMYTLHYSIRT